MIKPSFQHNYQMILYIDLRSTQWLTLFLSQDVSLNNESMGASLWLHPRTLCKTVDVCDMFDRMMSLVYTALGFNSPSTG